MRDWREPAEGRPTLGALFRAGAFVVAVGIGGFIGWRAFLAPTSEATQSTRDNQDRVDSVAAPSSSIPVRSTGTPAASLGGRVQVGSRAPDFTLEDVNGNLWGLSDFRGKAVVINFWTTWCPPCREEMPALQSAYETFGPDDFVVLAINLTPDDHPDLIQPFIDEFGLTFPVLLDRSELVSGAFYRVVGLPTSIFVGRDGMIEEILIGAIPLDLLDAKVQNLLLEPE